MCIFKARHDEIFFCIDLTVPHIAAFLMRTYICNSVPFDPYLSVDDIHISIHRKNLGIIKTNIHVLPLSFVVNLSKCTRSTIVF